MKKRHNRGDSERPLDKGKGEVPNQRRKAKNRIDQFRISEPLKTLGRGEPATNRSRHWCGENKKLSRGKSSIESSKKGREGG